MAYKSQERYCFIPGYKFKPLDEHIIYYLNKKINNNNYQPPAPINNYNVYGDTLEAIAAKFPSIEDDANTIAWYFYTGRVRKYTNGTRPNRIVGGGLGYWKASDGEKPVRKGNAVIGSRHQLVYRHGKTGKGEKSHWQMREYKIEKVDDVVLCKIYIKKEKYRVKDNNDMMADEQQEANYDVDMNMVEDFFNAYSAASGDEDPLQKLLEELLMGESSIEGVTMPQDALQDPTA